MHALIFFFVYNLCGTWEYKKLRHAYGMPFFQGQLGSVSSLESQQQTGNSQIYGTSRQSESVNAGSQGTFSPFRSGSMPLGFYALQRENVFPERPGQPECQFYMKTGDCKFGAVCRFHHPRERLIPAPDCVLSPIGLPLRPVSWITIEFFVPSDHQYFMSTVLILCLVLHLKFSWIKVSRSYQLIWGHVMKIPLLFGD